MAYGCVDLQGSSVTPSTLHHRYLGSLLGLACGDAVGTSVEFSPRGSFPRVQGMTGGGPFGLAPGQWTDDTSMALCLAESLIERRGFDALDQMERYLRWWRHGHLSSTGRCFDIGITTSQALARFEQSGEPFAGSTDPQQAGNGSLMRLAPVVLYFHPSLALVLEHAAASSRTTHAAPEAVDCCRLLAYALSQALAGKPKVALLAGAASVVFEPKVQDLARGTYLGKSEAQISGTGYAVASLEAALWCVHTTGSFEEAVLAAVNLGDDADTTGAITGQLAGALYGVEAIPREWLAALHMGDEIANMAARLYAAASTP